MTGFLAYSLAGHDKGELYLIIDETKEHVYVADGSVRPLDRPKKKNKKHIQIVKNADRKADISFMTNEEVRHIIRLYCKKQSAASGKLYVEEYNSPGLRQECYKDIKEVK